MFYFVHLKQYFFFISQRIFHENCCFCFGKCNKSPCSGDEGGSFPCSVCSSVIITSKTAKLKCSDNTEMIKVVKITEDCQCKTKEAQYSHHNGPVLVDPSVSTLKSDKI